MGIGQCHVNPAKVITYSLLGGFKKPGCFPRAFPTFIALNQRFMNAIENPIEE
jgi:hypothetical protein